MTEAKWPIALEANDMLVMTPQSLVNMLETGIVGFNKIDLLVSHSTVILHMLPLSLTYSDSLIMKETVHFSSSTNKHIGVLLALRYIALTSYFQDYDTFVCGVLVRARLY